jgi:hypothetical protein
MSRPPKPGASHAGNVFRFTLTGLIVFSLALMGGTAFIGYKVATPPQAKLKDVFALDPHDKTRSVRVGPWGELIVRDIKLGRPPEFLTAEVANPVAETWTFNGMKPDAVKALLAKNGLSAAQVAAAFAPGTFTVTDAVTVLKPAPEFLLSLDARTRGQLSLGLAGLGVYLYFDYPYIFPGDNFDSICADPDLQPDDVAVLNKLVYANGTAQQLSDYDALLGLIPTFERRVVVARALSRQSAVLAGLAIKTDTDIDKLANYWGNVPNVRITDIKPLMRALKNLPEGGNLSLFYVLPKFARDRLYTFPLPPQAGEPTMDCHWTTFNFSNETPDNRFNDPNFAVQYIQKNYYQIAGPSLYGDILLLMNDKSEIKHSAVYLADDLVFTKNGNNYRQGWMIMHIPDLVATYPNKPPMRLIYMRLKVN